MTDAEPFTLRREPAPRRPESKPLAIVATRQTVLFDPGRNDLPGQAIMFPDIAVHGDTKNLPVTGEPSPALIVGTLSAG